MKSNQYDVVVVGAGPAGSMAAKKVAENDLAVLLVEKHEKIGRPVCCAEGITAYGLETVIPPRQEWISVCVNGAKLVSPSGKEAKIFSPKAGYILNREVFDLDLAKMAEKSGAELITNAPVVKVNLAREKHIESVTIDLNGELLNIRAKVFIACDGIESRVADMAGLSTTLGLKDLNSACQYLVDNVKTDDDLITIMIGNHIAPGGYIWVFPKSANEVNIGVCVWPLRSNGKKAKDYLDQFMDLYYPRSAKLRMTMGGVPFFNSQLSLIWGNLMLAGDAARLLDSLTGAGIANALLSGSIAGEVAAAKIKNGMSLDKYPKKFMRLKRRELMFYKFLRSLFVKASDADFERIIETTSSFLELKRIEKINILALTFKLLLKRPTLLNMARYLIKG